MRENKNRFWEIDAVRGTAIILMVAYHFIYDIAIFGNSGINLNTPILYFLQQIISGVFILLVGISMSLKKSRTHRAKFLDFLKRGEIIFGMGLIITIVTSLILSEGTIIFGILHLIGVSIVLGYPFLKLNNANLIIGIILIVIGEWLKEFIFNFSWLVWLGFQYHGFYSIDYFPILPFFGLVLIGIWIGKNMYTNHKRQFRIKDYSNKKRIKFLEFCGRHSLLIYMTHQPIIIGILLMFGLVVI